MPSLNSPTTTQTETFEGVILKSHPRGEPLRYPHGDEHRDEAEVARSLATLVGAPVYVQHPSMPARASGARVVGVVTSARVDNGHAIGVLSIHDADARAAIRRASKVEISAGYNLKPVVDASGIAWQREIAIDHVALLPDGDGRCGSVCALRVDCQGAPSCGCPSVALSEQEIARAYRDSLNAWAGPPRARTTPPEPLKRKP